jgi:hypothetical protein
MNCPAKNRVGSVQWHTGVEARHLLLALSDLQEPIARKLCRPIPGEFLGLLFEECVRNVRSPGTKPAMPAEVHFGGQCVPVALHIHLIVRPGCVLPLHNFGL